MKKFFYLCLSVFVSGFLLSCGENQAGQKTYAVRGVVKEVKPAEKTVVVQHEKIPGYMEAMTMPFDVKNTNELRGLQPGDRISFNMIVTAKEGWIEHITKTGHADEMPSRSNVQIVKAIEPLDPGQAVPDFHLTNELGQAVSLSELKGKAVAITFFFIKCPFPNFCPRMNNNFAEVQQKLLANKGGPTNWVLLSVSFDPENDTPSTLLSYAKAEHYNPAYWHFLTGADTEIEQLCEAFDEKYWHEQGTISHNLRTVVIDGEGKLQKVFSGNDWKPEELAAELLKACNGVR